MSESQSAEIPGDLDAADEKVSVSTENDTEADIEQMDSIADYEVPIPDPEEEKKKEEELKKEEKKKEEKKKEESAKAAAESGGSKPKDSDKKEPPKPPEKQPEPQAEPPVQDKEKPGTEKTPSKEQGEDPAPTNKTTEGKKEPEIKPEGDVSKDKTPSIKKEPEPSPEKESSMKNSEKRESLKSDRSSPHDSNRTRSKSKTKSKSERSQSRRSPSNYGSSQEEQRSVSRSRSRRETERSERQTEPKSSRVSSRRHSTPQRSSTRIPSNSSRSRLDKGSIKAESHLSPGKNQRYRSSSYTTFARAETTPSHITTETDHISLIDTDELVSISVSSGLQSLREMFFDEHDSHKGYLNLPEVLIDTSYCSHGKRDKSMSKISHASFNSHLEPSPILLPDVDQTTYIKEGEEGEEEEEEEVTESNLITPVEPPREREGLSPLSEYDIGCSECSEEEDEVTPTADHSHPRHQVPSVDKKVDFAAGSDVISLTLDVQSEKEDTIKDYVQQKPQYTPSLSFTPNTLLCDISNIIPSHVIEKTNNFVEEKHILSKETCLEFMCWLENLNDLYMSIDYGKALNIFRRQESRFKLVLYEALKIAQGGGLDIEFERVAAMAHISFDVVYSMLPYCDSIKWYSQMVAGARRVENKLAESYMLLCMGQLMIYEGDSFEAQRHLRTALLIVKEHYIAEQDLYNCIKHLLGFSVALCDCNKISDRESGLIKMTEALVLTRNLFGTTSLETALGRLHIGIAYRSLYEDTALRLEGLDYVERAHEVLEDKLGHHPYMGICVQTLAQYHDDMLGINFSSQYNQALKCYKLAVEIHQSAMGGHTFTAKALTQIGDFYHRMADYENAGRYLTEAYDMTLTYCPTDLVSARAAFYLGLLYMDDSYSKHDIFRGQNLLTSSANLLSKYGVTYQRATILQHMGIASEEAGLKHTFYRQESENIKTVMFSC